MGANYRSVLWLLTWACLIKVNNTAHIARTGSRIVGGTPAYTGQFPFAAAINVQTAAGRFFCGGALITTQWVLTAAQCLNGATSLSIQLGSFSLNSTDTNRVSVATSDYFLHPDFNPTTLENDIGLLQLPDPVTLSNYIKTISSASVPIPVTTSLVAIGWGQIDDENDDLSDRLNWVQLNSISNDECKLSYGNQITDSMVCVRGVSNEGTCIGDSGSPLIVVGGGGQMVYAGVSSFLSGNGCDSTDPSGYTRTYSFLGWINNIINPSKY